MQVRYQIFISSPYIGLAEARYAVIDAVQRFNWFPMAMEFFPAFAGSSWKSIKKLIEDSDYFLVLLGGRLGTLYPGTANPITEMEYDYALTCGIPIARFVHNNPDALPVAERETEQARQDIFKRFREKLAKWPNQCAMWQEQVELVGHVFAALINLNETQPRLGWIRQTHAGLMKSLTTMGISDVYPTRVDATQRMFQDIGSSSQSCWISTAVYVRALILPSHRKEMIDALEKASNQARERGAKYHLSFCSLSDDISTDKQNASVLECWRQREDDPDIESLQQRIKRGSIGFKKLTRKITALSLAIKPERRFFRDYLVPHSLVVIDDSIVYVSFYDWETKTGSQAPTIRLQGGEWGNKLIEESHTLRSDYSYRDYRVIVFDFDGVIADSMVVQAKVWCDAARVIAVSPQAQNQLMDNFWKGAAGPRIFEHTDLDSESIQQLRQTKDAGLERLETTITVFEDSPRVLDSLARRYKLAIATTADNNRVKSFLNRHSLADCFDYVITDYDVQRGKPHAEMLLKIAEHFKCQPWQVCLVGDTVTDYVMSSNAGTDFVLFESHGAHGVSDKCVMARTWRQLEEILILKSHPKGLSHRSGKRTRRVKAKEQK